jgi:HK97 gp10 family phage protein
MATGGADYVRVTMSGLDDIEAMFKELGSVGTADVLRNSLKRALRPVAEEARRRAPKGTGTYERRRADGSVETVKRPHLAETIRISTRLSDSQMRRRGWKRGPIEAFVGSTSPYAHLIEFGHLLVKVKRGELRKRKNSGKGGRIKGVGFFRPVISRTVVGHVAARPFLRPAFDAKRDEVRELFFKGLGAEVERVARRYAKQAERGKLSRGARIAFAKDILL